MEHASLDAIFQGQGKKLQFVVLARQRPWLSLWESWHSESCA